MKTFNGVVFHELPGGDLLATTAVEPPPGYVRHARFGNRYCPAPLDTTVYHSISGGVVAAFPEAGKTAPCPPGYTRDENDPDVFHKIGAERDPVCKGCRGL